MKRPLSEILTALGEQREDYFRAMAPPIVQTSNFAFPTIEAFRQGILDERGSHVYTRGNNPTVEILRKKLAALEETDDALVLSSGSAACAMAIMSQVKSGDHVVCVRNPYSWTKALLSNYLPRFGVTTTYVDGTDVENIRTAIRPETRVIYLESPNTLTYELQDLSACADLAQEHGIVTMIDNSHASPIFQKPATLGIDLVIHTITKYLNGHSDVVAGAICGPDHLIDRIFFSEFMTLGAVVSPMDAALTIRGLRTLDLRMRRCADSAMQIVPWLKSHPKISQVLYPFDPDFPQYNLARRQMSGCGGLLTISVNAEKIEDVRRFVDALERFEIAVSWGGHESLVLPIAALYGLEGRDDPEVPWNVVRLYIGLEDPGYLIEDLERGLSVL
ncbi:MAG: aminotransferase class I/II-fold pyridoxal phosphate-dependent enzyme [Saprospiraceae bacterium]|nr:aminotransferase class I/II-fold pyridoxal phosphate-dependent enzyme [Saprospiraceae bacterium]